MKTLVMHLRVLAAICLASWIMVYIMGHFLELHPDAYRDMTRSILLVYAIVLLSVGAWKLLSRYLPKTFALDRTAAILSGYTPLQLICGLFLIITAANSLMMLTGIDAPKQGVFTYVHMLTRLMIVTFSIVAWKWQETRASLKGFSLARSTSAFFRNIVHNRLASGAQLFTVVTAFYCITAILYNGYSSVRGGALFYQMLLALIVLCMAATLLVPEVQASRSRRLHSDR